jgi:hypothetical protein
MRALEFWKTVTVDHANLLERLIALLDEHGIRYCVIGGQAVNAYVEPLVSLDLDLVVATEQLSELEGFLKATFRVEQFEHSLNVSLKGSDLRVQIQTDPRYAKFISRASVKNVLGFDLPVANLGDVLKGKVWAAQDPTRRGSKRQKDLADIARIIESNPHLAANVPPVIREKLE